MILTKQRPNTVYRITDNEHIPNGNYRIQSVCGVDSDQGSVSYLVLILCLPGQMYIDGAEYECVTLNVDVFAQLVEQQKATLISAPWIWSLVLWNELLVGFTWAQAMDNVNVFRTKDGRCIHVYRDKIHYWEDIRQHDVFEELVFDETRRIGSSQLREFVLKITLKDR